MPAYFLYPSYFLYHLCYSNYSFDFDSHYSVIPVPLIEYPSPPTRPPHPSPLQELHKYAHMMETPFPVSFLQKVGVVLDRKEHGKHHSEPFDKKYCIVSGVCNAPLDHFKV